MPFAYCHSMHVFRHMVFTITRCSAHSLLQLFAGNPRLTCFQPVNTALFISSSFSLCFLLFTIWQRGCTGVCHGCDFFVDVWALYKLTFIIVTIIIIIITVRHVHWRVHSHARSLAYVYCYAMWSHTYDVHYHTCSRTSIVHCHIIIIFNVLCAHCHTVFVVLRVYIFIVLRLHWYTGLFVFRSYGVQTPIVMLTVEYVHCHMILVVIPVHRHTSSSETTEHLLS